MSVSTWKKQFYTELTKRSAKTMSMLDALNHSIKKWTGLLPSHLKRHKVELLKSWLYVYVVDIHPSEDDSKLPIDSDTCALCLKYKKGSYDCSNCPLYQSLDEPCDEDIDSVFAHFKSTGNPNQMIKALLLSLSNQCNYPIISQKQLKQWNTTWKRRKRHWLSQHKQAYREQQINQALIEVKQQLNIQDSDLANMNNKKPNHEWIATIIKIILTKFAGPEGMPEQIIANYVNEIFVTAALNYLIQQRKIVSRKNKFGVTYYRKSTYYCTMTHK